MSCELMAHWRLEKRRLFQLGVGWMCPSWKIRPYSCCMLTAFVILLHSVFQYYLIPLEWEKRSTGFEMSATVARIQTRSGIQSMNSSRIDQDRLKKYFDESQLAKDKRQIAHKADRLQASQTVQTNRRESEHRHHNTRRPYRFNCSNIHQISIKRKLGHGVSKQVYLGLYGPGGNEKVAVKMTTRNVLDVTNCLKKRAQHSSAEGRTKDKSECYILPNMKLMKEILLLEQIDHPNLIQLLGYCVRSEETDSTSLQEHGIVAVYEYGQRFYSSSLADWPFERRLRTALELADFLEYLERSPLGSLRLTDFKEAHFLMTPDDDFRIKLTDLDDVNCLESSCDDPGVAGTGGRGYEKAPAVAGKACDYGLRCVAAICTGYNAKHNIDRMNRLFFRNLFVSSYKYDTGAETDAMDAAAVATTGEIIQVGGIGSGPGLVVGAGGSNVDRSPPSSRTKPVNRIYRQLDQDKVNYYSVLNEIRLRLNSIQLSATELKKLIISLLGNATSSD